MVTVILSVKGESITLVYGQGHHQELKDDANQHRNCTRSSFDLNAKLQRAGAVRYKDSSEENVDRLCGF
jgi:hypothetical protein